jgi:uncharacterized damage-inducible protein DinB
MNPRFEPSSSGSASKASIRRESTCETASGRRTPFSQTFQHLVNHGTYHRGQVVTMLRQLGAGTPPSTDLIAFYREQQAV